MDRWSKSLAIQRSWRNSQLDSEAVTTLHLSDGSAQEIQHGRRVVAKKFVKRQGATIATLADIDRSALDRVFPFDVFTVADWPNLFVDAVGKRVCQGVGHAKKIPLTLINTDQLTFWTYAGPRILAAGAGVLQTVYRGYQPQQGAIVDPSEYVTGTATAPSGYQVVTVTFAREQADTNGRVFLLEADYSLPGSQAAADELARVLAAYGIATDASFAAAAAYDVGAGFAVDAVYGGDGRAGTAIVADLSAAARAWMSQTATGAWALVQDSPKASVAQYDTSCDLIELDEYGDGDIPAKVTLFYGPKASLTEDWIAPLSRNTGGASGELQIHNPYIGQDAVADRIVSYWAARLSTLREASGRIFATQRSSGDRISVTDAIVYSGTKDFIVTGISRPGDINRVKLREYDANVYVYVAGALPAGATNGYSPDYSFTPPLAPAAAVKTAGGTSSDTDGKTTAWATIRVTPPANSNWARLMVVLTDTTTGEEHPGQARLAAGNYDVTIGGLRPNRNHTIEAWAVNSNNVDGASVFGAPFTSANFTTQPSAPASCSVVQKVSLQVMVSWPAVADIAGQPKVRRYIVFEQINGGGFSEVARTDALSYSRPVQVSPSTLYAYKIRTEDQNGNESNDSAIASITPVKVIDGGQITDGSINRGRSFTGTTTITTAIPQITEVDFVLDLYSFFPSLKVSFVNAIGPTCELRAVNGGVDDKGRIRLYNPRNTGNPNDDATGAVQYRNFLS